MYAFQECTNKSLLIFMHSCADKATEIAKNEWKKRLNLHFCLHINPDIGLLLLLEIIYIHT